jgi:hypothetical protein
MNDTTYHQLPKEGSCKTVFMGHQRWLADRDDVWRSHKDLFDYEVETIEKIAK